MEGLWTAHQARQDLASGRHFRLASGTTALEDASDPCAILMKVAEENAIKQTKARRSTHGAPLSTGRNLETERGIAIHVPARNCRFQSAMDIGKPGERVPAEAASSLRSAVACQKLGHHRN